MGGHFFGLSLFDEVLHQRQILSLHGRHNSAIGLATPLHWSIDFIAHIHAVLDCFSVQNQALDQ